MDEAVAKEELEVPGHALHFGQEPFDEVIGAGEDVFRIGHGATG